MLSVLVPTRNEVDRLERCLGSVQALATEILVFDCGSVDGTPELARALGAEVRRVDWPGFAEQRRRLEAAARCPFVLHLDADEALNQEAAEGLRAYLRAPPTAAAGFRRRTHWLGHTLRYGRFARDRQVRVARRGVGDWRGLEPHPRRWTPGGVTWLPGALEHVPYRDAGEHWAAVDGYSRLAAAALREQGRRARLADVVVRPWWQLNRSLFLDGGLADGVPGVLTAGLGAACTFLKWRRLWLGRP